MGSIAAAKISLFARVVRTEVSEAAVGLMLGSAEVVSEGEVSDARYLGSTLVAVDLAPLAHRFEERPDARIVAEVARAASHDPTLRGALEMLALAEAHRRLGSGRALRDCTFDVRASSQDLGLRFTIDLDAAVAPAESPVLPDFDATAVEAILGIPRRRLRSWARTGFLPPSAPPKYTFLDLVRLKAAWSLVSAGASLARVRAALRALSLQIPDEPDPLAHLRVVAIGDTIVVRRGEQAFEVETGQHVLEFDLADLRGEIRRAGAAAETAGSAAGRGRAGR